MHLRASRETGGGLKCDAAHCSCVGVAVNLQNQRFRPVPADDQGGVDLRQDEPIEAHLHHGAANRYDSAR
jgi:hypothetical protein